MRCENYAFCQGYRIGNSTCEEDSEAEEYCGIHKRNVHRKIRVERFRKLREFVKMMRTDKEV